jgi:hypothetical protein
MDESADVRQSTVFVDGDLEGLDRVREGLGVHSLQTLMTPPKEFVLSVGAVARQLLVHDGRRTSA